jgi:uncharacterized membrane protein YphA (DoxX/SURF4 family)
VHRFFSPFPDGRPGVGLLLLRAVAALTAIGYAVARLSDPPTRTLDMLSAALSIASSLALLVGLFTAGSAVLLAVAFAWLSFPLHAGALPHYLPAALLTIADAVAISLLGPGAFSVDARLFGPREIVIPRDTRAPRG